SPEVAAVASRLPAQIRRGFLGGGLPVTAENDQKYRDAFTAMLRMLKKLYDAGQPIVAGTDATAGFALHRELENYVAAGIPSAKVLQLPTPGAPKVMKHHRRTGPPPPRHAPPSV